MKAKELQVLLNQWGLILTQLDRGYITEASDYYFKVKEFDREKDQMYIDQLEIPSKGRRFNLFKLHFRWIFSIETNMSWSKIGMFQAELDQMCINGQDDFLKKVIHD